MVVVRKMPGQSDETVIKIFSRKVTEHGIIPEAKNRKYYLKPSLAKKQKQEDARRARRSMW